MILCCRTIMGEHVVGDFKSAPIYGDDKIKTVEISGLVMLVPQQGGQVNMAPYTIGADMKEYGEYPVSMFLGHVPANQDVRNMYSTQFGSGIHVTSQMPTKVQ